MKTKDAIGPDEILRLFNLLNSHNPSASGLLDVLDTVQKYCASNGIEWIDYMLDVMLAIELHDAGLFDELSETADSMR